MVKPEIVEAIELLPLKLKIRLAELPLIVTFLAPGPVKLKLPAHVEFAQTKSQRATEAGTNGNRIGAMVAYPAVSPVDGFAQGHNRYPRKPRRRDRPGS